MERHRLNRGGNRRVNAVLHIMAVTQLRCEPRARKIWFFAKVGGAGSS
ncbi:MAG: transposase [Acidimicrobiia bacterium]